MMNMIHGRRVAARKSRKGGFTLIEVIVVIVIIAILAAIAVPSLTKYINAAEKKAIQAAGHNIQLVLQADKSANYNEDFSPATGITNQIVDDKKAYGTPAINYYADILLPSGVTFAEGESLNDIRWDGNTLSLFWFTNGKYYIVYNKAAGGFGKVGDGAVPLLAELP